MNAVPAQSPGTNVAYAATRQAMAELMQEQVPRAAISYAAATRCPVLTYGFASTRTRRSMS
eukprot:887309-Rhodomonas_salina.5